MTNIRRARDRGSERSRPPAPTYSHPMPHTKAHHTPGAAPWKQWGDDLEPTAIDQMRAAAALPVSVAGALMPDAHPGFGLPIGGVLATDNAVIPYAVGVDIACRMRISILDTPPHMLRAEQKRFINALERETRFGVGAEFSKPYDHPVMDMDWSVSPVSKARKDRAWAQLGTSGSGNHFVEFGVLNLPQPDLGLEPGEYLALLSHSGSRGAGAAICDHYSKLAMSLHPELTGQQKQLAWLPLDTEPGQEYWQAMNLMGHYAAANHELIHRAVARNLGARALAHVENHHNFAWKEEHGGVELIVHRKGATPAGEGVLGVIPGSMTAPAFIVRGRGAEDSLLSASHGAGRVMSRTEAKKRFTQSDLKRHLEEKGVHLISAGIDEAPFVYKDIHQVMAAQTDLVDIVATFEPKLVKMAPAGERPED